MEGGDTAYPGEGGQECSAENQEEADNGDAAAALLVHVGHYPRGEGAHHPTLHRRPNEWLKAQSFSTPAVSKKDKDLPTQAKGCAFAQEGNIAKPDPKMCTEYPPLNLH